MSNVRVSTDNMKSIREEKKVTGASHEFIANKAIAEYFKNKSVQSNNDQVTAVPAAVKKPVKPKEKFDASEVDLIGLNRESWLEWVEYRKAKRKPITKAAAKKQVNTLLARDEETQKLMIDQSIANDYQGIFEVKAPHKSIVDKRQQMIEERNRQLYGGEQGRVFENGKF